MADPGARILGEVADMDDIRLGIGVDHDCVTIGAHCFTAAQMEDVAQLLVAAVWQAGQQKGAMDHETAEADRRRRNVVITACAEPGCGDGCHG